MDTDYTERHGLRGCRIFCPALKIPLECGMLKFPPSGVIIKISNKKDKKRTKYMKKTILFALIIAVAAILVACASQSGAGNADQNHDQGPNQATGQSASQGTQTTAQAPQGVPAPASQARFREGIILEGAQRYTVRRGDTLSRIARTRYNNGYLYPIIYIASGNTVLNPDRISPGMVLTIPNLQLNLIDPGARENLKNILLEMAVFEDQRGRTRTARDMRNLANGL